MFESYRLRENNLKRVAVYKVFSTLLAKQMFEHLKFVCEVLTPVIVKIIFFFKITSYCLV
jgi:hypothetical protein